jgi:glyoxylase-like metal-dependent hydrolase (beta-lactamase superfamily II)
MTEGIYQLKVGNMANFTYIISDIQTRLAAIVDPSWDLQEIFQLLTEKKLKAKHIINTHSHFDHVFGNDEVAKVTGATVIQHSNSQLRKDISVAENDVVLIGSVSLKVLHTPGHSKDSICLIIDKEAVFTGDTLFVGAVGRIDLPGGNPKEMYLSLYRKVSVLEDQFTVYPGHDYGSFPVSTIGKEKRSNLALQAKSESEFLAFMGVG